MARTIDGPLARRLAAGCGVAAVAVHYAFFASFLPNPGGTLGADYGYFLPHLLDGELWRQRNGWLAIPWFTPSFCGGLPKFPNPQSLTFSVPQLLTGLSDPLTAVRGTLLLFGAAGWWGFYLLQRRLFRFARPVAVLGATLFLFNTLFSGRMMVGHLTFHAFMLVPWLPLWLLEKAWSPARLLGAALVLAYLASHAIAHVLFQALAITVLVALLQGAFAPRAPAWPGFFVRLAGAGAIAMAIAAAKLAAMAAHLEVLPRTLYPLPGVGSLADLFQLAFVSVFLTPYDALLQRAVVNSEWALLRQEFEFGVGPVPLYLLGAALVLEGGQILASVRALPAARVRCLAAAGLLLLLPLATNLYQPGWNAFLKSLPVVENSSSLFRWWQLYVPAAALLAALVLQRTRALAPYRPAAAGLGAVLAVGLVVSGDYRYYRAQPYDPTIVLEAFEDYREGRKAEIHSVGVAQDPLSAGRNETLAYGVSQLACYETLFGFRMENFPLGTLRPGSVFQARSDGLNLKDPSCYVFPEANGCAPGDPFPASRRDDVEAFVGYRPFPFQLPARQRAANATSGLALVAVGVGLAATGARGWAMRKRRAG